MASVLLAEPSAPVAGALRRFLEAAGHEVSWVGGADEALRTAWDHPPAVLVAATTGSLDGEALCRGLRAQGSEVPVLLVYPPEEDRADERASECGADGCLVGPLKRGTVVTCVGLLVRLGEARRAAVPTPATPEPEAAPVPAEAPPEAAPPPLPRDTTPVPGPLATVVSLPERRVARTEGVAIASPDFEFLKRLMLMEVKRSRRYRYPISLLLVGVDRFTELAASLPPAARTAALAEALGLLVAGVRDIDVAVPFADSRFVVFLPHTPRSGALVVAERLRAKVRALRSLPGATVSVGVAVSEPPGGKAPAAPQGAGVSFGSLLKEAGEALRRAQAAGGDKVEAAPGGGRPQAE